MACIHHVDAICHFWHCGRCRPTFNKHYTFSTYHSHVTRCIDTGTAHFVSVGTVCQCFPILLLFAKNNEVSLIFRETEKYASCLKKAKIKKKKQKNARHIF